jgi:predicted nucleic acid-binding protein
VADANVLFDLRNGRILTHLAALPYRFIIPDAVFVELDPILRSTVQSLGFEIGGLEAQSVLEIYSLRPEHPRISVADLFALFVARDRQAMLLTGDNRLKRLAETRGLTVHGTLWVLDELFAQQALNAQGALAALERILALGGRLPASDCQKRRALWK